MRLSGEEPGKCSRPGHSGGRVLLVTGTSGVGKTFTIEQARALDACITRLSASDILRRLGRPTTGLTTSSAADNQSAICAYISTLPEAVVAGAVLDGHAILETDDGLFPLQPDILSRMRMRGIALVEDETTSVRRRRDAKGRSGDLDRIRHLQHMESVRSNELASELSVPFGRICSGDGQALLRMIRAIMTDAVEDSR